MKTNLTEALPGFMDIVDIINNEDISETIFKSKNLIHFNCQTSLEFSLTGKKPIEYGLYDVREVFISTPDNLSLLAWFQIPKKNNPILIYFHGNSDYLVVFYFIVSHTSLLHLHYFEHIIILM